MFKRSIRESIIKDAFIVMITSIILVCLISVIIYYSPYNALDSSTTVRYGILECFYEVSSAFGTVGLSMGITAQIAPVGLMMLVLIMFVGQLGVSSTLLS